VPTPDEGEGGGDRATPMPTPTVTSSSRSKYPLSIILARGLTPTNVAAAITQVGPWAVDVSGGMETEDGLVKYFDKVWAFIVGGDKVDGSRHQMWEG
jgi:anthranilate synthase/indole-3-glycerol phosphate synthase/phosphoribosylanthranilate isomerase